jgi:predicted DNA-binding ribbon-helix-helix protein
MPAKNPRVNVVLEKPIYSVLHELADAEGVSMSMLVRDLVKEALELREDRALAELASEREADFDRNNALSHDEVWG